MAKEPFLVNPPKRAPKRKTARKHVTVKKKSMVGMKRHRILAFEGKDGGLFSSPEAKIVRKGIKLNPFKRFRKNPLGEELMFVGLNPFKKKGGSTMAHKKRSKKRSYKKNPAKRRRYHRNPMSSMKSLVPMVIAGGAGALIGRAVPPMIPVLSGMGMLGNLVSKVVLAVGGAMLIDKTGLGKKMAGIEDGWLIGSLASAAADLAAVGTVGAMQGLGLIENDTLAPYTGNDVSGIVSEADPYAMSGNEDPY